MGHVRAHLIATGDHTATDAVAVRRRPLSQGEPMLLLALAVTDAVAIVAAAIGVSAEEAWAQGEAVWPHACALALFAGLVLVLMERAGLFALRAAADWPACVRTIARVVAAAGAVAAAVAVGLDLARPYTWSWFAALLAATALALALSRGAAAAVIRRLLADGTLGRAVAIVGATRQAALLVGRLAAAGAPGTRLVGVFDERLTRLPADVRGLPVLGDLSALAGMVRCGLIDDVIVALPWNAEARVLELIGRLRPLPVNVALALDTAAYDLARDAAVPRRAPPVLGIHAAPLAGWRGVAKAAEDKLLALAALVALAPLMLLIAVLIRLDSRGPVIFRQKRGGFNNEVIEIYKFRTMYYEAQASQPFRQARRDDPRVTRIGRLLRRASLDELPQLFNVLQGRMSLVGPRPHPLELNAQFASLTEGYDGRHRVKPGITGWAQINGYRGETDTLEKMRLRVELDLWYVEHWSMLLDVRILLVTLLRGWTDNNAY